MDGNRKSTSDWTQWQDVVFSFANRKYFSHPKWGPPLTRSNTWAGFSSCLNRRRNFTPWLSPLLELTKTRRGLAQDGGHVAFQKPIPKHGIVTHEKIHFQNSLWSGRFLNKSKRTIPIFKSSVLVQTYYYKLITRKKKDTSIMALHFFYTCLWLETYYEQWMNKTEILI